jgi:hypothetical protein
MKRWVLFLEGKYAQASVIVDFYESIDARRRQVSKELGGFVSWLPPSALLFVTGIRLSHSNGKSPKPFQHQFSIDQNRQPRLILPGIPCPAFLANERCLEDHPRTSGTLKSDVHADSTCAHDSQTTPARA